MIEFTVNEKVISFELDTAEGSSVHLLNRLKSDLKTYPQAQHIGIFNQYKAIIKSNIDYLKDHHSLFFFKYDISVEDFQKAIILILRTPYA